MKPRVMKPLNWCTNQEQHHYMAARQRQNVESSRNNPNELWMLTKLEGTRKKWRRQAQWGFRLFDFWCHELGIAVEVDGPEHDAAYDGYRDEYNLRRSGILVLRVRNRDEADAALALKQIEAAETWTERKARLGILANTKRGRRALVS